MGIIIFYFFCGLVWFLYFLSEKKYENEDEKKSYRSRKILFIVYTLIVFVLAINKIFAYFYIEATGGEYDTYWRMFWLLPMPIGIGYFLTEFILSFKHKKYQRVSFVLIIILIFLFGGTNSFLYSKEDIIDTHNEYKVPDEMLDVVEYISSLNLEYKKLAGTEEFSVYTRAINGTILLSEGRFDLWGANPKSIINLIYNYDFEGIREYCTLKKANLFVNYKVLEYNENLENIEKYGFSKLYENEKYILYKFIE